MKPGEIEISSPDYTRYHCLPSHVKKQMTDQPVVRQLLSCAFGHQLGSGHRWSQADGPGHPEGPQGTTHALLDKVTHWPTMKPTHLARLREPLETTVTWVCQETVTLELSLQRD